MNVQDVSFLEENPFYNLNISDKWKDLHDVDSRTHCPKCFKSRKYFCYTCYVAVAEIQQEVPFVKLPIKVDIIKHCREIDGKSTAAHAAVIAPNDVSIYIYPFIPEYDANEKVILVYPGAEAISLETMVDSLTSKSCTTPDSRIPFTRVIFIDSTWNQSKGIFKDPRLHRLPCVILKSRITQFWRHQKGKPRWHLATIEAIHQFFVELEYSVNKVSPNLTKSSVEPKHKPTDNCEIGTTNNSDISSSYQYDNLLFFFRFMYDKIHTLYNHNELKSYKRPIK